MRCGVAGHGKSAALHFSYFIHNTLECTITVSIYLRVVGGDRASNFGDIVNALVSIVKVNLLKFHFLAVISNGWTWTMNFVIQVHINKKLYQLMKFQTNR